MNRKRLEIAAFLAFPVIGFLAIMHLNAQIAQRIDRFEASTVDVGNEEIIRDARARGAISPYVDTGRIEFPIDTLREIALREAKTLGLRGEPSSQQEFYLTQGQRLTATDQDISREYLPDRTIPLFVVLYNGNIEGQSMPEAAFIEIMVDATTGEVVVTAVGPSRGERIIDVNIEDQGYLVFDTSMTPQAPLSAPDAPTG